MPRYTLLSLVFLTFMGGIGAWMPFLSLTLERSGLSAATVGGLLALLPLTRLAATPLWALAADRLRLGGAVLKGVSVGTVLVAAWLAFGGPTATSFAVGLVIFATLRAPAAPLIDAQTLRALEDGGGDARDYGRIRLWGSVGFAAAALISARLAESSDSAPLLLACGIWAIGAVLTFGLPEQQGQGPAPVGPALKALAGHPGALALGGACALHGIGLSAYDSWLTVHVESLGLATRWSGACIAVGVLAEIAVLASGRRLLGPRSPGVLVTAAMAVSAVRWALTAIVAAPIAMVALQSLHGISYGLFWLGAVEQLRRWSSPEIRASAQALLVATTYGLGPLMTSGAAATLVDRWGSGSLFVLAALAAALGAAMAWRASRGDARAA